MSTAVAAIAAAVTAMTAAMAAAMVVVPMEVSSGSRGGGRQPGIITRDLSDGEEAMEIEDMLIHIGLAMRNTRSSLCKEVIDEGTFTDS